MFDASELSKLGFIDTERHNYSDFKVTIVNYDESKLYFCENDHEGATPAILSHQSMFDPKTGDFSTHGTIVMACKTCGSYVMTDD